MTAPPLFRLREGAGKLLVNVPHAGTYLPATIQARLTPVGQAVIDTDWHVDRLYDFVAEMDATLLTATHSRTVVDLNRSPTGGALYPGQAETGICPLETFDGALLYTADAPDAAEIAQRVELYWRPYHTVLAAQIARVLARHGTVHILDGHSIRGEVPRLFAGRLPDLNFGTHDGASCAKALEEAAAEASAGHGFSIVRNGRFKGGFITRHYGKPDAGVHVIQLELAQRTYVREDQPEHYDPARAARLIGVLRAIVAVLSRA